MGIEFLKHLLAAAGLRIDESAAENLRADKSLHLRVREIRIFLNWSGKKKIAARSSIVAFSSPAKWIRCLYQQSGNIGK